MNRRAVVQRLESLQRAGVTHVKKVRAPAKASVAAPPAPAKRTTAAPTKKAAASVVRAAAKPASTRRSNDPRQAALDELAVQVAACTRCQELARTRTQTVFGVGNPYARLVFCGEAPGADEDRLGQPFVGRAGQLLTDIIVKGMKMRREDVYILNVLRCRPPANRTPSPAEAANCRPWLDGQLAILQPKFICCLGAVAAQNLLATDVTIGRLRGKIHDFHGIKVVCTYHPAYLLRNPDAKRFVWNDVKMLMAEMAREAE